MSRGILVPAWASASRGSAAEGSGSLYSPRELRELAGSGITVVDTISDAKGDFNAGGLTPWPGHGWYGVYMKTVFSQPPKKKNQLFGRQTTKMLGPRGSPRQLPGFGFDPGVLIGSGNGRIVTWHTSGVGVQVTKSNQGGWDTPQVLADDTPGITAEATCGMFGGVQMACYAWRLTVDNRYWQQVRG